MVKPFTVIVPASTANIGPGFDSLGLAVNLYCTLKVEASSQWGFTFSGEVNGTNLPLEKNLVYKVVQKVSEYYNCDLVPLQIHIHSEIPLERGLGSSAAAIIGGIEIVDTLFSLALTKDEKLKRALEFENHIDNIGAALLGGLIVGATEANHFFYQQFEFPKCDLVAVIPPYALSTKEARGVLPSTLPRQEAVSGSGISNVLVAGLATGNWGLVKSVLEKDSWHEPYRAHLIPELQEIRQWTKGLEVYGTVISGAGSTLMIFLPEGQGEFVKVFLEEKVPHCKVLKLQVEKQGPIIKKMNVPSFE